MVLFLTLEVVPKLTLERLKSGTETNSPAFIYTLITQTKNLISETYAESISAMRDCLARFLQLCPCSEIQLTSGKTL